MEEFPHPVQRMRPVLGAARRTWAAALGADEIDALLVLDLQPADRFDGQAHAVASGRATRVEEDLRHPEIQLLVEQDLLDAHQHIVARQLGAEVVVEAKLLYLAA